MSSSFEQWQEAERRWLYDNSSVLALVLESFLNDGAWPSVDVLQHVLHKGGDRTTDVRDIANAKPTIPGQFVPADNPIFALGARHVIDLPAARTLMELIVQSALSAVDAYLDSPPGTQPLVALEDVKGGTPGQATTLHRVAPFMASDHPKPFAGYTLPPPGSDGGWVQFVDLNTVMEFEGIKSPEDYVARQLRIIRGWCDDFDARVEARSAGGPHRIFIVMPFDEAWSGEINDFIRAVLEPLGEFVRVVRADDITTPGRITDQIADEISNSHVIVADITGNNPNVAWELGFAHALAKPCVILRNRNDDRPAPFDIYDFRRTEYTFPPTEADGSRLLQAVQAAIELSRVRTPQPSLGEIFRGP